MSRIPKLSTRADEVTFLPSDRLSIDEVDLRVVDIFMVVLLDYFLSGKLAAVRSLNEGNGAVFCVPS